MSGLRRRSLVPFDEVIVDYTYREVDVVPVSCMFTLTTQCELDESFAQMSRA